MLEYFKTTRKLIDLQPVLAIPAHGALNYEPCSLLRSYIAHRQAREDQILGAITQVRAFFSLPAFVATRSPHNPSSSSPSSAGRSEDG
jgi:hypothetical protein